MQTQRLALAFLVAALPAGCVGIEDYERKTDEAAGLRREVDTARNQIQEMRRKAEALEARLREKDTENEELSQSLTMARRHGQQTEASLADLRARVSSQQTEHRDAASKAARFERAYNATLDRVRNMQKNMVAMQKRLLRFEDRIRFQIQLEKDMKAQLSRERRRGAVTVRRAGDRVTLSVSSAILFRSGSAKIRNDGKALLRKIADLLRRYANREVQVQGHTDNVQISDRLAERWETNWELSAARATRVLRYLVEARNLDPRRASAAGMGEFRPVDENRTRAGRRRNRRIEILIFPPKS